MVITMIIIIIIIIIYLNKLPVQTRYSLMLKESQIVANEIEKLFKKGVLHKVNHTEGGFLSNIFLRGKKDGSYILILNLKNLNQSVTYKHFKMETLASALQLIKLNC